MTSLEWGSSQAAAIFGMIKVAEASIQERLLLSVEPLKIREVEGASARSMSAVGLPARAEAVARRDLPQGCVRRFSRRPLRAEVDSDL